MRNSGKFVALGGRSVAMQVSRSIASGASDLKADVSRNSQSHERGSAVARSSVRTIESMGFAYRFTAVIGA